MFKNFKLLTLNFKRVPKGQAGFTIVEVLISTFIFSIIVTAVSGLFVRSLDQQRRAFAGQKIQENGLYILETMSREIRVSEIENQESPGCSLTALTVIHPVNGTVTYTLANGILQRSVGGVITNVSTSDIKLDRLNFCVIGSGLNDLQQPRVTILAAIQNRTGKEIITVNVQTTVASRNFNDEFQQ